MNDLEAQIARIRERHQVSKREEWDYLVAAEARGEFPEGVSIVALYDETCGELDAILEWTISEIRAAQQRCLDTLDKMLDVVNEYDARQEPR